MAYSWTPKSAIDMWERVKADPKTYKHPPFPKTGEVEVTAICRHTPIKVEWDCDAQTITIDGKAVKILFDREWAYKVRRNGIYTMYTTGEFVYQILWECVGEGALDSLFYDMLLRAKEKCAVAA